MRYQTDAGIALLVAFSRRGIIRHVLYHCGVTLAFPPAAVILAQTSVAAPFYVQTPKAVFGSVDRDSEEATAVDGARPLAISRLIRLPLSLLPLAGGAIMTWARSGSSEPRSSVLAISLSAYKGCHWPSTLASWWACRARWR